MDVAIEKPPQKTGLAVFNRNIPLDNVTITY